MDILFFIPLNARLEWQVPLKSLAQLNLPLGLLLN